MKMNKTSNLLVIFIIILAAIASAYGFFSNNAINENQTIQTIHNETVTLYGKGLYHNESVSMAAQVRAQEVVTLVFAIPLLLVSLILNKRSLKGKLLLVGTLGYFLYTYMSYSFLAIYNNFFLIYVLLMSLSFFAFIINITSQELQNLEKCFLAAMPSKPVGIFIIVIGIIISLMWLGRIVPTIGNNTVNGLEHYTTFVIQAMDLGIVLPVTVVSGVLLLRKKSLGYLLAPIIIIKGITLLLAIDVMAISMAISGVSVSPIELILFPSFTVIFAVILWIILKNFKSIDNTCTYKETI